jgi:hypothetical protein
MSLVGSGQSHILPIGIEAGVEITLGPVWNVETTPKPILEPCRPRDYLQYHLTVCLTHSCLTHVGGFPGYSTYVTVHVPG